MLGSGINFGLRPDLHRYGLLAEWENAAAAYQFFATDSLLQQWTARGWTAHTTWLQAVQAHGTWNGVAPFQPPPGTLPLLPDEPVAILTRAAIHWRRLWAFWRAVPAASRAALGADGLRFSIGLGELPLVRQATLSVWDSLTQMQRFAYHAPGHRTAIQRTRAEGWYAEELFVRFRVLPHVTELA